MRLKVFIILTSVLVSIFSCTYDVNRVGMNADKTKIVHENVLKKNYMTACAACHGPFGEGNIHLKSPSIAGLPRWYTELQIDKYKKGHRGADTKDISGHLMRVAVTNIDEKLISDILAYVQNMPVVKRVQTIKGDPSLGRKHFYQYCASCHRYNASGELTFKSAPLVYFPDWYLKEQLVKFKKGFRGYHSDDDAGKKMVKMLSIIRDDVSLNNIISYIFNIENKDIK